jgi:membrane associated rhomboid family serine protease
MSPRGQQAMSFGVPPVTRGVKWLGIATLVLSVASVLGNSGHLLGALLVYEPALLAHLQLWRLFTYTFLSPEPLELLFSLLGLWLIGASLEERWGTRKFVIFYLVSSALAGVLTFGVGLFVPSVMGVNYAGNWAALEALVAAIAVMMPDSQFFLYIVPVQARWMLPISGGITLLYMLMGRWQLYLPQLFGLGVGVLLAGRLSPGHFWLRARVWWIDRRLKRSNLRVVRGIGEDKRGARGSDKYLH